MNFQFPDILIKTEDLLNYDPSHVNTSSTHKLFSKAPKVRAPKDRAANKAAGKAKLNDSIFSSDSDEQFISSHHNLFTNSKNKKSRAKKFNPSRMITDFTKLFTAKRSR